MKPLYYHVYMKCNLIKFKLFQEEIEIPEGKGEKGSRKASETIP